MMIQNNRFLPPSPLPHSLLPRGRRQGRYVPFSANHTNGTTYDFLGQLIAAGYSNTGLTDESYSYDSNGNRITANGSNYTTGSNNELTSDGSWTYTYDDEGNRVSKTNSTHRELYEWDYRNRLTKVTQQEYNSSTEEWQDVQIVEYTYDYNNIWIRKLLDTNGDGTPDSKSIFIPENYQTTVQLDDTDLSDNVDAPVTHHYLWMPNQQDKLLADTTNTTILWSLTDHLGTIRDILSTTETTHLIYDAFGNLTGVNVGGLLLASYQYGAKNGLLAKQTYGNGEEIEFEYDRLGRTTLASCSSGRILTYAYNGDGQLYSIHDNAGTAAANDDVTYFYTYDSLKRAISCQMYRGIAQLLSVRWEYDDASRVKSQAWQMGQQSYEETYTYSATDGNLTGITRSGGGNSLQLSYDSLSRLASAGNGVYTRSYTYRDISSTQTTT
ncbi:MAG: hypothetical protein ACI4UF_05780, partial [Thermoguttaceae bacterium]